MTVFNVTSLKNLRPKRSAYYVRDKDGQRGRGRLVLKVQPSGNKTFFFQYYNEGRAKYINIGAFTGRAGELPTARAKRDEYAALLDQDIDPKQHLVEKEAERMAVETEKERLEEENRKLAEEEARMGTVAHLFASYTDNMRREGKRTWQEVRKSLNKEAIPLLGAETKARDVPVDGIKRVLHSMIDRGARTQSNRVRSYLMTAFNFGIQYDNNPATMRERKYGIVFNPVSVVPKQKDAERVGERDLSPKEIQRLFSDLPKGGFSPAIQTAIKLCFATGGQRPNEVLSAEWSDFNFESNVWQLPSSKTKNKKAHLVPLTDFALSVIAELPGVNLVDGQLLLPPEEGGYLFPNQRDNARPMKPTSMSRAIKRYCDGDHLEGNDKSTWHWELFVPRDIRRTCKTQMGALRISKETRDRINNHALNDVSARHYDRYDYLDEKRIALESWCDWLRQLTTEGHPGPSKVVPLFA